MKVAIISHTEHYKKDNVVVGWGPTIKELNKFSETVSEVCHFAPLHHVDAPSSAVSYKGNTISHVALKPSGGKGIQKLSILFTAPINLYILSKHLSKFDKIQFRAPTGMGLYVLPFLYLFYFNKYWVKYAGNWKDEFMPLGNKIQKYWLQKITSKKTKITVNGNWKGERENITPFENPCLDEFDRTEAKDFLKEKELDEKIDFCFVGALNYHKGVDKIIESFTKINSKKIGVIHFVGDGIDKKHFETLAKKCPHKIVFHGFLPKDKIKEIYKQTHFLLLPSKSEGFPKVVGEAMNFGCVPIVSDVSCVDQYIQTKKNGFLIDLSDSKSLTACIEKALQLSKKDFSVMIQKNYQLAEKFTYSYYNKRIHAEIIDA